MRDALQVQIGHRQEKEQEEKKQNLKMDHILNSHNEMFIEEAKKKKTEERAKVIDFWKKELE